jgi:site-specific DNA recombinase
MGHVEGKNSNRYVRAALYARVSSEQQAQAQTIASQIEALKDRIAKDGLALDQELSFIDDGYSGASLVRPALERLRDMAALGAIDKLYVLCPDRFARNYAYQVLVIDELQCCGVELVFLNHEIGDSPEEHLLLQVQGIIAEYERGKIMERCRRGKLHAARQGTINVLGGAPYGYRYISCQEAGGQARYEIILEQARVVRQIFQWIGHERLSIGEACRRLQKQGIRTATGKYWWDRTTIWGILKNPAYKGMAAYGKTRTGPMKPRLRPQRGDPEQPRRVHSIYNVCRDEWIYIPVPAIVTPALFDMVQEQLEQNRKRNRQSRRGARYLLQGLLVCKACGYAYYGKPVSLSAGKGKRRAYAYYRCIGSDAYRFGGQRICYNKQVRTDLLGEAVWQDVCSLLREPERITQEHQRRLTRSSHNSSLDHLKALTQKVKRGISRLIDAYQDGLIDRTEFEPRLRHSKERLSQLDEQILTSSQEQKRLQDLRLVIGQVDTFAKMIDGSLEQADFQTKRQVIRTLVKHIEIGDEDVKVIYRVDGLPFVQAPEKGLLQHCLRREIAALGCSLVSRDDLACFEVPCLQKSAYQKQKA